MRLDNDQPVDMSAEAVTRRLKRVAGLVRLDRKLFRNVRFVEPEPDELDPDDIQPVPDSGHCDETESTTAQAPDPERDKNEPPSSMI